MTGRRRGRPRAIRSGTSGDRSSSSRKTRGSGRRQNESVAAYNRRLEADRLRKEANRSNESPVERRTRIQSVSNRQRERLLQEDETERSIRLNNKKEAKNQALEKETDDEKMERLKLEAEQKRLRFAEETEEERNKRLQTQSEYKIRFLERESTEERETRLQTLSVNQHIRITKETPEERDARLQTLSVNQHIRIMKETPDEREARLQTLSVNQHIRIMKETIKFSRIWPLVKQLRLSTNMRVTSGDAEWTKWLIDVGEGRCNDDASTIEIPVALKTDDIVREVYTDNVSAATDFSDTIILAPTNLNVDHINEMVLNKMEGIEKTYTSYDVLPSGCTEDPTMVTPEVLNSVTSPSLPMHQLKLKKGCPVILLRNLDVAAGLCNGTRLIVDTFHQRSLGCSFACGPNKGKRVPIPRIACTQDDGTTIPIKRIQIPVRLCFAMTINKSQGQTFTKVGLSLNTQVFGHGQLYVALSRVRSKDQLKIQYDTERVQNVVLTSILQ